MLFHLKKEVTPEGPGDYGKKVVLTEQTSPTICISSFRAERFCITSAFKIHPQDRAEGEMQRDEQTEVDPGQKCDLHPQPLPSHSGGCFV